MTGMVAPGATSDQTGRGPKLAGQIRCAYHKMTSKEVDRPPRRAPPAKASFLPIIPTPPDPSAAKERPLTHSLRQMTAWGVMALIALRLGVGWHFFKEGVAKFTGEGFTSVYFLQQAKGPMAEFYKSMIPDREGRLRLDRSETARFWEEYRDEVARYFGFDDDQRKRSDQVYKNYLARLKWYYEGDAATPGHGEDIREYLLECDRLAQAKQEPMRKVAFQRDWIERKEAELRAKSNRWLADLRSIDEQYQSSLHELATDSQRAAEGSYAIPDRSRMVVDTLVKYTVLGVGVLLMLGLFTRFASLVGIGFLLSVMSTQPPWVAGAETSYIYYQLVEVLALVVLIAMAAGYFGGLDFLIRGLRLRCCPPQKKIEI